MAMKCEAEEATAETATALIYILTFVTVLIDTITLVGFKVLVPIHGNGYYASFPYLPGLAYFRSF